MTEVTGGQHLNTCKMIHLTCIYPTFCNTDDIVSGHFFGRTINIRDYQRTCLGFFSINRSESRHLPHMPYFSLKLVVTFHRKIEVRSTTADTSLTIALLLGTAVIQYIFLCEGIESCNNKA